MQGFWSLMQESRRPLAWMGPLGMTTCERGYESRGNIGGVFSNLAEGGF